MYVVESLRRVETRASSLPVGMRVNALLYGLAVLGLALVTIEVRSGASTVRQVQAFPLPTVATTVFGGVSPYAPSPPVAAGAPPETLNPSPGPDLATATAGATAGPETSDSTPARPSIVVLGAGALSAPVVVAAPTTTVAPGPASITFVPQSQLQAQAQSRPQGSLPAFTLPRSEPPPSGFPAGAPAGPGATFPQPPLPAEPSPAPAAGPVSPNPPPPLVIQPPNIITPATPPPLVIPRPG